MTAGIEHTGTEQEATTWRFVRLSAVILVLALFLWSVQGILNPFLLLFVLVAVLHPFRGSPGHTALLLVSALLTFLWLLHYTGFLLAPFFVALILAYLLDPLVDRLSAGRLPRVAAILILSVPLVGAVVLALLFGLPALGQQVSDLIEGAPSFLDRLADWIRSTPDLLLGMDVRFLDENALAERIRGLDGAALTEFLRERQAAITASVWGGVLGLGRGIGSAVAVIGYVVLTPVLTFYLLRDYDDIVAALGDLLPHDRRVSVTAFAVEYDRLLARYLRGQFTVAVTVGGLTALGLWVWGFPYAFLLGVIVAVLGFVPYLGLVLSLIPALAIALFITDDIGYALLKVAVVYGAAQALEATVISPKIVGDSVGLHPVWVVLALAVGGYFLGFVGLLVAVPVAVGVKLLAGHALERYRNSGVYGESPSSA